MHIFPRFGASKTVNYNCKALLDMCMILPYSLNMIKSIRHKALRAYWTDGQKKGLNADWIKKLNRILSMLDAAERPEEMNIPGYYFHPLKGRDAERYSLRLSGNFRVTFSWDEDGATDIDIEDYH